MKESPRAPRTNIIGLAKIVRRPPRPEKSPKTPKFTNSEMSQNEKKWVFKGKIGGKNG